jgi:Rod binding domain-containing protein
VLQAASSSLEALVASRVDAGQPHSATSAGGSSSRDEAKLRKAAGEFEAILLNSLWKSMKETFTDQDDPNADPTLESYNDWGMQAMSSAVGNAGGLGIKDLIMNHLGPSLHGSNHDANSPPQTIASGFGG